MSDVRRTEGDTGPPIKDTLATDGSADDLSGATVVFTLWDPQSDTLIQDENTANVTIEPDGQGTVTYEFDGSDLDISVSIKRQLHYEWEVTFSSGEIRTYRASDGSPKSITVFEEGA